jgi:hypothetical protein
MQALISSTEEVYKYDGTPIGWRVAQVEPDDKIFPVADTMFWVTCADNVVADQFYYDNVNKTIDAIPVKPVQPQPTTSLPTV